MGNCLKPKVPISNSQPVVVRETLDLTPTPLFYSTIFSNFHAFVKPVEGILNCYNLYYSTGFDSKTLKYLRVRPRISNPSSETDYYLTRADILKVFDKIEFPLISKNALMTRSDYYELCKYFNAIQYNSETVDTSSLGKFYKWKQLVRTELVKFLDETNYSTKEDSQKWFDLTILGKPYSHKTKPTVKFPLYDEPYCNVTSILFSNFCSETIIQV